MHLTISNESVRDANVSFSTLNPPEAEKCNLVHAINEALGKLQMTKTKVVRSSSEFESKFDPQIFNKCFPQLLPFGRGGFDEYRENKISLEQWIQNVVYCSNHRFQSDKFILFAYELLMQTKMYKGAALISSIKTEEGKKLNEACFKLTAEDIRLSQKYTKDLGDALKNGLEIPKKPEKLSSTAKLFLKMSKGSLHMPRIPGPMQKRSASRFFACM